MRNPECAACGATDNLQHHHLVPRSLGGGDDDANLITLCGACHAKAHSARANWGHNELTRRALAEKKARGERVGHIPFGMRLADDGKRLEPDPNEQATIGKAEQMRALGLSLRQIADGLNAQGIRKRGGAKWNHVNLHTMLQRPPAQIATPRQDGGQRCGRNKPNDERKGQAIDDIAAQLKVHPETVRRWVRLGQLKSFRAGRQIRVTPDDLTAFLNTEQGGKP